METSDNARVASWYLSKIADSKDNSEINSNPLGFREALVDILCSHTDLRVDNSQMTDEIAGLRELLKKHKEFNEHMHEMPPEWTVKRSIELHKETIELLYSNK